MANPDVFPKDPTAACWFAMANVTGEMSREWGAGATRSATLQKQQRRSLTIKHDLRTTSGENFADGLADDQLMRSVGLVVQDGTGRDAH